MSGIGNDVTFRCCGQRKPYGFCIAWVWKHSVVLNAGHFDFLAPCGAALASRAPEICASAVGFDRSAFHTSFNAAVLSFFNKMLRVGAGT